MYRLLRLYGGSLTVVPALGGGGSPAVHLHKTEAATAPRRLRASSSGLIFALGAGDVLLVPRNGRRP